MGVFHVCPNGTKSRNVPYIIYNLLSKQNQLSRDVLRKKFSVKVSQNSQKKYLSRGLLLIKFQNNFIKKGLQNRYFSATLWNL